MVSDARIPPVEQCVLGHQLERWATQKPDAAAFSFTDGTTLTWRQTLQLTQRFACGFAKLGVQKGDHVLSWLPNGRDALFTWFGLNYLGAVYVPLNTAYKGNVLTHLIKLSDARLIVCHSDLCARLDDVALAELSDVIVVGGDSVPSQLTCHDAAVLYDAEPLAAMPQPVAPWDVQYIIFTSGTTGPSKAVLSPYLQGYAMGPGAHDRLDESDRILINLPLFHVGGTVFVISTLALGGSAVIDTHFRTEDFWETVRTYGITMSCLLAAMVPFLANLPVAAGERDHPMRKAVVVPWTHEGREVAERFGIDVWTSFNMTEVSSPLVSNGAPQIAGSCGTVRAGIECRVVDEFDCEVPPGVTGELIVRSDCPWSMNVGYYKNPEATAHAWRNGWFHTGDGFRYDESGNFFFVDRIKDAIRRRGENISSFEVENEVVAHPCVAEAAAIAVPSELGEDEVMVVVAATEGATVDPKELFDFLEPRLAHFMLPRYIRLVDALPKTPTQKITKHFLKADGVTADTWDRARAGVIVRRERVGDN